LNRGLAVSVALHAALFFLVLLGPGPSRFEWERADAIAVDLVSPVEPPPETPPPPEPPKEEPKIEPEPQPAVKKEVKPPEPVRKPAAKPRPRRIYKPLAPKSQDDEEPSLEERLRSRLADEESLPEESTEAPPEEEAPLPAQTAEVEAADFPYAWYLNVLHNKITDSWDPPGTRMVAGRGNQVLIRFRIHRSGRVTDVRVEGASETPGLDASARRAVDSARPFPPLPESYEGEVLEIGVRFTVSGGES
jgi:TonB family protein